MGILIPGILMIIVIAHPDPRKDMDNAEEHECRVCHNSANSPNFQYDVYVQKIIHAK